MNVISKVATVNFNSNNFIANKMKAYLNGECWSLALGDTYINISIWINFTYVQIA